MTSQKEPYVKCCNDPEEHCYLRMDGDAPHGRRQTAEFLKSSFIIIFFSGERETNVYSHQIGCQGQTRVTIQTKSNLIDMSVPWRKQMKILESFHSVRVYWITVDLQKHDVIARHS